MSRFSNPLPLLLLMAALATPALADDAPYDAATKTAVQSVISKQLDALAHEDGKTAESFASPALQEKFPDPDKFLAMVKSGYGALLHPRSTRFGEFSASPHGPLQTMTVVAADGTVWTAIYSFAQVDGGWRITGCGLKKLEGEQDI